MTTPPARVRNPFALWDGSWDFRERPICTIPKPSMIIPTALASPKMKSERLLTTVMGSLAANAVVVKQVIQSTVPAYAIKALLAFLLIDSFTVSFFLVSFLLGNSAWKRNLCYRQCVQTAEGFRTVMKYQSEHKRPL